MPALPGGWFVVEGPAGFDVLYFLLSPTGADPHRRCRALLPRAP